MYCNLSWTPHSNLEKDNSLKTTPFSFKDHGRAVYYRPWIRMGDNEAKSVISQTLDCYAKWHL